MSAVSSGLAQEKISDEVSVTVVRDHLLGITRGEGVIRLPLVAGEEVLAMEARGINAFVRTQLRLLGFSGPLKRWIELRIGISETVLVWHVTPRLILVQGQKRVYGFQGPLARWRVEEIRTQEKPGLLIVKDHVAVLVTDRRALAFSAFTGGFFAKDLPSTQVIPGNRV